jgi:zinc finger protein
MATNSQEDPKPDGAAFDDFFDSIGKKAENLNLTDQTGKKDSATPNSDSKTLESTTEDDEPKVVDEIESLCMNCRENV